MKEIPSTRGLFEIYQGDKKPKSKTRSVTADQVAEAEARIKSQATLLPKLSDHNHKTGKIVIRDHFIA